MSGRLVSNAFELNGTHLEIGDRVEPSVDLSDIGKINVMALPFVITFWRARLCGTSVLDSVQHRCPLFSAALSSSPSRTLAIDSLHT
eukprot:4464025-Pyramimonas_sp.AAC.1